LVDCIHDRIVIGTEEGIRKNVCAIKGQ